MLLAMMSKLTLTPFLPRVQIIFQDDGVTDDTADDEFGADSIDADHDDSTDSDADMVVYDGDENDDA